MVKTALSACRTDADTEVPWSGFDLINAFNAWKKTQDAERVFVVDAAGTADVVVTGLAWRGQVYQQVFEEAAVDCGRGLGAWSDSRAGRRKGPRIGFPRFKKKTGAMPSFRLRNKHPKGGKPAIRVGDRSRPRLVVLPGIGLVAIHDDTRRLRRMLAKDRAKILFATVSQRAGRWWVCLNVEAADLHPGSRHPARVVTADRWYPSSQICSRCRTHNQKLSLADRVFSCACGHSADRDLNAAVNLAHWGEAYHGDHKPGPPSTEAGSPMPANGTALAGAPRVPVKPARMTREPKFKPRPRPESRTSEKGGAAQPVTAM